MRLHLLLGAAGGDVMRLFSWIKDQVAHASQPYTYAPIDASRVEGDGVAAPLVAERSYLRLWLAEMSLAHDRTWFTGWHPAVHATVQVSAGSEAHEYPSFAHPLQLGFDSHLGAVVSLNHGLTPLVPFRGGTVEVVAGLVGLPGGDHLAQCVKMLGGFASLLGSPATASVAIAGAVVEGVRQLLGPQQNAVHLGFHDTFVGAGSDGALGPAHLAVIAAPAASIDMDALWVKDGRLQAAGEHTFMLFRVETRSTRDDWAALSSITSPRLDAHAALATAQPHTFAVHSQRAITAALTSPDLTAADRTRVALALHEEFQELQDAGLGATADQTPGIADLIAHRAISIDDAYALGQPTLEDLLA